MADTREWCKLDVGYLANPKVAPLLDAHPRAVLLHLAAITYSKQHRTNGVAPIRFMLALAGADVDDLNAAFGSGLLEPCDARGNATRIADGNASASMSHDASHMRVHDYLDHQEEAHRAVRRSENARNAALARWNKGQGDADADADSNATRIADGNADSNAEKRREEKNIARISDAEFETFWQHYPRKVDKGHARSAYKTARKKVDAETLLAGVQQFAASVAGAEPKYIAHCATWLNGERWSDQPTLVATGTDSGPVYRSVKDLNLDD